MTAEPAVDDLPDLSLEEAVAVEERDRGGLGGGFKGKDLHSARILPPPGAEGAADAAPPDAHPGRHGAIPGI